MIPINYKKDLNKETEEAVYFYTPEFYALDNFSAHTVNIWGIDFPTAEHAYQWKKYSVSHPEIAKSILEAKSAHGVKVISNQNKDKTLAIFHKEKTTVMEEILRAKAAQHEDVREKLFKTGERTIIENSPTDSFWGIGSDDKGENMVEKIWMKIREDLKK